jgi:hypothetical protein
MKPVVLLAILLILVGVMAFSYQGVVWITGKETIAKVGPIEVQREKQFPVPLVPIIGCVAVVTGLLLALRARDTA